MTPAQRKQVQAELRIRTEAVRDLANHALKMIESQDYPVLPECFDKIEMYLGRARFDAAYLAEK